jgi:hypothetical protein
MPLNKDFDSVIFIKDDLTIEELRLLKHQLYNEICRLDTLRLYHFKLFNLTELRMALSYDSFRIWEFQLAHPSFLDVIQEPMLILDEANFINSMLIQEVYTMLELDCKTNVCTHPKLQRRVKRNLSILKSSKLAPPCEVYNYTNFCASNDSLYREFKNIRANKKDLWRFMPKYFARFRHEYINKEITYMNAINAHF